MKTLSKDSWLLGFIALGLTWGSSFLLIKLSLISLTPMGVAFYRGLIGGLTLLIFCLIKKDYLPKKAIEWGHLAVVALLLNSIPGYLFALGESYVSSVVAGLLNATTPLMTVLVISVGFREQKIDLNQIIGILTGFIGVLLVTGTLRDIQISEWKGYTSFLIATFCYGIAFPYSKRFVSKMRYSSSSLAASQVLCSAIILFPLTIFTSPIKSAWTATSVTGIFLLGAIGTGFAYIWNFRTIRLAGSAIASTVTYVTPVVAIFLGIVFLKESVTITQILGGVLVLISAALVQNRFKLIRN